MGIDAEIALMKRRRQKWWQERRRPWGDRGTVGRSSVQAAQRHVNQPLGERAGRRRVLETRKHWQPGGAACPRRRRPRDVARPRRRAPRDHRVFCGSPHMLSGNTLRINLNMASSLPASKGTCKKCKTGGRRGSVRRPTARGGRGGAQKAGCTRHPPANRRAIAAISRSCAPAYRKGAGRAGLLRHGGLLGEGAPRRRRRRSPPPQSAGARKPPAAALSPPQARTLS